MKKRAKLLSIFSVFGLASVVAISTPLALSKTTSVSVSANEILGTSQNKDLTESTVEAIWVYNADGTMDQGDQKKSIKDWEYYGKKYPSEITPDIVKSLIKYKNNLQPKNIEIRLLDISDMNDYISFEVIQKKDTFDKDGNFNGITEVQLKDIEHKQDTNTVWDTKHLGTGVFKSKKYSLVWKDANTIAEFLKSSSNKNYDELTVEDVLNNFIEKGDGYLLPEYNSTNNNITITKKAVTNEENDKKYGTVKITINFNESKDENWVNSKYPTEDERTITIRGLNSTSGNSTSMQLEFLNENLLPSLLVDTTKTDNPLFSYLTGTVTNGVVSGGKFTDLFPSEVAQLDQNTLKGIFLDNDYLTGTNKLAELKYYDKNVKATDFVTTTGLSQDIVDQLGVNTIEVTPHDTTGALTVTYNYTYYDVYTSSVKSDSKAQVFKEGTFKVNPDADKVLTFGWKDNNSIGMTSSYELVNNFKKNQDDADYVKALSNLFFDGSNDAYAQDRTVSIDYVGGSTQNGGNWVPTTTNQTQVEVTLTFNTWNGSSYQENGQKIEGKKETKVFTLPSYNSTITNLTWKSKDSVTTALGGDISEMSVTDVANKIFTGDMALTTFVDGANTNNVSIITNANTGSITITIVDGTNVTSQVFSGFKKESTSAVSQFSWVPSSQVSEKLQMTNVNDITKELVIEEYLSKLDAFQGKTINPDDVTITPKPETNSIIIEVKLSDYDASYETANRTFTTELKGFVNTSFVDGNSYTPPMDLTIVLSVILAVIVSATLIGILAHIVVKRNKLEKARKQRLSKKGE